MYGLRQVPPKSNAKPGIKVKKDANFDKIKKSMDKLNEISRSTKKI